MNYPILSVVIWLPIAAGLMVLAVGDRHAGAARVIAFIGAIAGLLPGKTQLSIDIEPKGALENAPADFVCSKAAAQ